MFLVSRMCNVLSVSFFLFGFNWTCKFVSLRLDGDDSTYLLRKTLTIHCQQTHIHWTETDLVFAYAQTCLIIAIEIVKYLLTYWVILWLCWGLTSQSTIFQSCRDGAIASWVINQYFRGVKCLAQGHNTAEVGLEPRTSRSGVRHSTTEPPRSPLSYFSPIYWDQLKVFASLVEFGVNSVPKRNCVGACTGNLPWWFNIRKLLAQQP